MTAEAFGDLLLVRLKEQAAGPQNARRARSVR